MRILCRQIALFGLMVLTMLISRSAPAASDAQAPLLIDRQLQSRSIRLVEINDRSLIGNDLDGQPIRMPIDQCVALLFAPALARPAGQAILRLSDGQVLPGSLITDSAASDGVMLWRHERLGRMDVPLDRVTSVQFTTSMPVGYARDADLISLANGDRLEGFVTAVSDPVLVEIASGRDGSNVQSVSVPLANVASLTMVAPAGTRNGTYIWFKDGLVLSVDSIRIADDGFVRLTSSWIDGPVEPWELPELAGIVFDSAGIIPLAAVSSVRIDGPDSRYVTPGPEISDGSSPADLAEIECRGPVRLDYSLPPNVTRFAAEAILPSSAESFGDYELIIRADGEVLFRHRFNASNPRARINVAVTGSELLIELTEGANGPIQDRLILSRAMLLVE
ncbi:MAG: hypothetical protein JSV91_00975 [Phycisphaerales bacterium]|nr:MAG: hypothetical protein JSV91_00975 [Phycisphaerales bacterium]